MISQEDQEEGSPEVFQDDLAEYQDQMEEQICNDIMAGKRIVEDDADHFQKSQSEEEQPKKELTEAERLARDLKLRNARKYFEVVKLTYIKEVNQAIKQAHYVSKNYRTIVSSFLSLLSKDSIELYQKLKKTQPLSMKIEEVVLFIKKAKQGIKIQQIQPKIDPAILFWSICESLKIGCRKIFFFDLHSLVQETFYKLNYISMEKALKKEARRAKETQLIKIQIDLKRQQEQKKEKPDYIHFEDFEFDANSFRKSRNSSNSNSFSQASKTQTQINQNQVEDEQKSRDNRFGLQARRENNFMRKRNYKWAYFHVFSVEDSKWRLINSQILEFQKESEYKSYLLASKPIIGFYSCRLMHFKDQYRELARLRLFKNIVFEDLTMYFFDNMNNLNKRRKRVGVKFIMKQLFEKGGYNRHRFFLDNYDQHIMERNDSIELQFQKSNFPKSKQEMLNSQFFIVPSMLPQYSILDPKAQPIGQDFLEQKVYLRRDLIPVTSRMVWIDRGRKVKPLEIPVKKTENKSKNMSELFLYEQTEPYYLSVDQSTGNFIPDDQYNSIYVPPEYVFDNKFEVITKKIGTICNKHNFRYVKLVQGFNRNVGRILPNQIGFLIYKEDKERILELWQQRQKYLKENKSKMREQFLMSLWTKLFNKIELNEWSHNITTK